MEIHKPAKPVHNWRELLTEIGVVVIGVCIALAAEQAVEWVHWTSQVAEARGDIGNELARVAEAGIERVRVENCGEQRLDALTAIVDAASRSGSLPPVPQIGQLPNRPWPNDVWLTVVSSQTASHFPRDELTTLGSVYTQVQTLRASNQEESLVWANLSPMIGPGRRLDPASETALRTALSQARYYNRIMALVGGQVARRIATMHLPVSPSVQQFYDTFIHRPLSDTDLCKPMNPGVPSLNGQAPLSTYLNIIRDWQKYPPYVEKTH